MKKLVNIHTNKIFLLLLFLISTQIVWAQEVKKFISCTEVLDFAKSKNYTFKNAILQTQLADLTRKIALGNAFNPKIPTSAQALNNIKQQVSFLPGQAFGLPAGTFKEVVIGQQYVTTFNIQPQFDLLNMANYAQIKTAKINQQLTENQNKINQLNLYEKINAVYFNILSFHAQKEILLENIKIAEKIKQIVSNKFNEGIVRKQDLNEAEVNLITLQDKLEQVEINTQIQYKILNLFFENEYNTVLTQSIWDYEKSDAILEVKNNLFTENAKLQSQVASQEYKSLKYQNLPVLSAVSSFNWQNLSNVNFFSDNARWINYNYIGLKLSYDLPTTIQKYSNLKSKQLQVEILKNNEEHSKKENESRNSQMLLEHEKGLKQRSNFQKIYELKKDTYEKNFNQFNENILPLDKLLISQNDMIISKLNFVSSLVNVGFNKTKIEINNGF